MDLSTIMRQQWNQRAQIDPLHHAVNRYPIGEWNPKEFYRTGEVDIRRTLDPFVATYAIHGSGMTALEIGCGPGRLTHALARRFKQVVALDVSDDMLAAAQAAITAPNVTFIRGSGINLAGIETASIDFVFSLITLQHIPDVEVQYTYLREVARVLTPGGWFFIQLYADQDRYAQKRAAWQVRADSGDLKGWSDAARIELQDNAYQTSMQTAVDDAAVRVLLAEVGLSLVHDVGAQTSLWFIGGQYHVTQ